MNKLLIKVCVFLFSIGNFPLVMSQIPVQTIDCNDLEKYPRNTPLNLLTQIECNESLLSYSECPAIPIQIGKLVYGKMSPPVQK